MRILLSLLALSLLCPLPAQAYLTPEEVLEDGDYVEPPPNARNAAAARAAQEAEYDARAAEAKAEADAGTDEAPDSNTLDDLHGSADDEEVIDWEVDGDGLTAEERRDERVLGRIQQNRLEGDQDGVVLHGGAPLEFESKGKPPLAPTGTGTVVLMLTGAAAIGFTLRKALLR